MADNFIANPGAGGDTFAADDVAGVKYPISKLDIGADGVSSPVTAANPLPVELTDGTNPVVIKQLSAVPVATDAALMTQAIIHGRTTAGGGSFVDVKVNPSGALSADVSGSTGVGVTGPLTNAELRAANVPTSNNATIFQFSTGNTSTAQLAAAATFAGAIETALDQPSISLLLTSDQPITLTVKQYIDLAGARAVPDIVFYVAANTGFARSFTLNGNYVQVQATNTGASTTTTFNLNTAYGDLGDSESGGIMPVTELPLVLTGAAAQTATVNNILQPTAGAAGLSVAGYRTASVQVVSTGTAGTFIFEQSNDGTNWIALPVFNAALTTAVPITAAITATASQIIYTFPLRCVFLRLRIATTITGGSIQAFTRIGTDPWTPSATLIGNNTAANVQTTATVTGYPTAAASADGLANPTITQIGAAALNFNGTTWDRARNNVSVAVDTSSARTASGTGVTFTNHNGRNVSFWLNVTAVSGTTPTMTVRVQWSPDNGTTWVDMDTTNLQTASITATGNFTLSVGPGLPVTANRSANQVAPRLMRLAWTIGGTTPSFTFVSWANTSA